VEDIGMTNSSSNPAMASALFPFSLFPGLFQPINPGWTFGNLTISEQNSSAPDTERDVIAVESYGRQLGHVIDALTVLVKNQPDWQSNGAIKEFMDMRDRIERIKTQAAARRLDRIAEDLGELAESDRAEDKRDFRRLLNKLRGALAKYDRP
jgi:hypothetical protein